MACSQRNLCLRQILKRGTLRQDPAQKNVVLLHMRLLPGCLGITVKDLCSGTVVRCVLQLIRVFEFHTVVGEDHREQGAEGLQTKFLS